MSQYIRTEAIDGILTVTLSRPEKRNAFDSELIGQLSQVLLDAHHDTTLRVVVLKAEGKAFCAGADLGYLQQLQKNNYDENLADSRKLKELFRIMYYHSKILISQVEGAALAGGCGIATTCDIVYATPAATFGYTEVKIGFVPAVVMVFLLRKIGESRAREMMVTGRIIEAQEAQQIGLVHHIVAPEAINQTVMETALALCRNTSSQSVALTRLMMAEIQNLPTEDALNYAAERNARARSQSDCKKGIAAFLNKEPLDWTKL